MGDVHTGRSRIVCVLLASGRGVRMGGPKALLWWDDACTVTLAEAHVRARSVECGRVVLVTRHDIAQRLQELVQLDVVESLEPDEHGPAGSIAAACCQGAVDHADLALLTPVDVPPVCSHTANRLLAAMTEGVEAARPRFGGRGGHPVVVRAACLRNAYSGTHRPPLRDLLRRLGPRCVDVDVQDPDIRDDLDTVEAFQARTGRLPRFA